MFHGLLVDAASDDRDPCRTSFQEHTQYPITPSAVPYLLETTMKDQQMSEKFVCRRCNLPVGTFHGGWKHFAGSAGKGCGDVPDPVPLATVEAEIAAIDEAIRLFLGRTAS